MVHHFLTEALGLLLWFDSSQGAVALEQSFNQTQVGAKVADQAFSTPSSVLTLCAVAFYYGIIGMAVISVFFGLSLISSGLIAGYLYAHRPLIFPAPVPAVFGAVLNGLSVVEPPIKFLTDSGG